MDKKLFLAELLRLLPDDVDSQEKAIILNRYEEIIEGLVAKGYSEYEAVLMLEDPEEILRQSGFKNSRPKRKMNWLTGTLLVLGFPLWGSLLLAVLSLVFTGYILLWLPVMISGSFFIAGILGGGFSVLMSFFALQDGLFLFLTQFGIGVAFIGVGLLSFLFTYQVGVGILKLTRKSFQFLLRRGKDEVPSYEF
ncbi:DUF1700 domain-containing protein [Enterococcus songbeiensis]|uniref:DUF1700 domain-containing protein n=1 Tax=Enterococcus songbeiensis TaxID=2559927 RepID=UPI0010F4369B|nr:DUF1700 domain-containing protein [Enterococcus songbeiensis]